MKSEEVEEFRRVNRRREAVTWYGILTLCAAVGYGLGEVWSYALSIPLAAFLAFFAIPLQLRLSKRRWIRRFPELAGDDTWARRR